MNDRNLLLLLMTMVGATAAACNADGSHEPLEGPRGSALSPDELVADAQPLASSDATFEIEMHNDTTGQWFSPCLCAIHHPALELFKEGWPASTGLATFAEDGFNGIYAEELSRHPWVYSVLACEPGLTAPGQSRVEVLEGPPWARLTCAAMPVTTNDVLTVVQRQPLPWSSGGSSIHQSVEWDLGSEEDNYSPDFIPLDSVNLGPGGTPTVLSFFARAFASEGVPTAEGAMEIFEQYVGSADFPAEVYGWSGSASTWTITRLD